MSALARAYGIALEGLTGVPVEVQTHIGPGLVGTTLVGLPDASLREAKERVRAALFSCGIGSVNQRVTVNLTPADLPKTGSGFDLAIAVSMLIGRGILPPSAGPGTIYMAELGLDGSLLPVSGVLPATAAAADHGFQRIVVPHGNVSEAKLLEDIEIIACSHLEDLVVAFQGCSGSDNETNSAYNKIAHIAELRAESSGSDSGQPRPGETKEQVSEYLDVSEVQGQQQAVLALTVAAVGGHHVLFHGPPGAGKTMLARRLPGILPDLKNKDALVATALRSLVRSDNRLSSLVRRPPIESPHHSATLVSLVGGGNPIKPGAVSLAHAGILLLDEAPEFSARTLDALRQPIEREAVTVHRAKTQVTFPARFQLVMTANPCPCGGGSESSGNPCRCSPHRVSIYRSRLSGPLLDRVDLQIHVDRPRRLDLLSDSTKNSALIAAQVAEARARSEARWRNTPWSQNAQVPGRFIRQSKQFSRSYTREIERLVERGIISLRGADRILRMAWSAADLRGAEEPNTDDFSLAMRLRGVLEGTQAWI